MTIIFSFAALFTAYKASVWCGDWTPLVLTAVFVITAILAKILGVKEMR